MKSVLVAAAVAGVAAAGSTCSPVYEAYICDDGKGGEYETTATIWGSCATSTQLQWENWASSTTTTTPAAETKWTEWPATTKTPDPSTAWSVWPESSVVTVTMTETFVVPCSTGWATQTTTIYTTHCGCTETPVPVHPVYATYTTEVPDSWGMGKTVTYTAPAATADASSTWAAWEASSTVDAEASSTWAAWTAGASAEADASSTWAEWSADASSVAAAETWAAWSSSSTPVAASTSATWAAWSSGVAAASATGAAAANGTWGAWSPVATFQGAASTSAVSSALVMVAGAFAAFALYL